MLQNTQQQKIIRFTNVKLYEDVVEDILTGLRDGSIKDCVIVAHRKNEGEDSGYSIRKYWFGLSGSCIMILGLLQYMIAEIQNYIFYGEEED